METLVPGDIISAFTRNGFSHPMDAWGDKKVPGKLWQSDNDRWKIW